MSGKEASSRENRGFTGVEVRSFHYDAGLITVKMASFVEDGISSDEKPAFPAKNDGILCVNHALFADDSVLKSGKVGLSIDD